MFQKRYDKVHQGTKNTKRYKMVKSRYTKVQLGTIRYKKVQKGTKRYKKVRENTLFGIDFKQFKVGFVKLHFLDKIVFLAYCELVVKSTIFAMMA